jgi:CubicO group peptidase (beta-lactamase class C family)
MSLQVQLFTNLSTRVRAVIERALAEERLVGAVVFVSHDGVVIHRGAMGFADREANRPMREDTIFRYSSLTKPLVSAAAMALVERGALGLDDAITRWLPEFRPRTADGAEPVITVRHLLTHTAGLSYSFFQPDGGPYYQAGVSDGLDSSGLTMEEELRRLATVPLSFAPGTDWGYSLSIDVLGEVLARAVGAPLSEVLERFVTGPLQMVDTRFGVTDPDRLAVPYVDGRPPRRMQDPDLVSAKTGRPLHFSPARIFDSQSFVSGGVGLAGTATDFLRFLEAVRTGGDPILKRETVQAMMSNQIGPLRINTEPTPAWGFGFGGAVLMDPELAPEPYAGGTWRWGGVYGHQWYLDPENRLSVVSLTNTSIEGMAGDFVGQMLEAVYGDSRS